MNFGSLDPIALFSSAADIVSEAGPMPSRPSSILPSNLFSNRIGSATFYQIFPIFGLNVHNIVQKPVELEFWSLAFKFYYGFLITKIGNLGGFGPLAPSVFIQSFGYLAWMCKTISPKNLCGYIEFWFLACNFFYGFLITNRSKLEFLEVFGHILKMFLMPDHKTWVTGMLWVLPGVCEKWPLRVKFSGPLWPRIVQKLGQKPVFHLFLQTIPTGFKWNLFFKLTGTILGSFSSLNLAKIGRKSFFAYFAKGFHWIHMPIVF